MTSPESAIWDSYLSELQLEHGKLLPFETALPLSYRLLNQEIDRVATLLRNTPVLEQNVPEQAALLSSGGINSTEGANNTMTSPFHLETSGCSSNPSSPVVKRRYRIDIPVEQYPNFDIVGSLVSGPRGDFLKIIEATTGCRVLLRGRGSIEDPKIAAAMMGKPGYEHLNEALHVVIVAELPVQIIVVRAKLTFDMLSNFINCSFHQKGNRVQQNSREPAPISGTHREVSPMNAPSTPFNRDLKKKKGNS